MFKISDGDIWFDGYKVARLYPIKYPSIEDNLKRALEKWQSPEEIEDQIDCARQSAMNSSYDAGFDAGYEQALADNPRD